MLCHKGFVTLLFLTLKGCAENEPRTDVSALVNDDVPEWMVLGWNRSVFRKSLNEEANLHCNDTRSENLSVSDSDAAMDNQDFVRDDEKSDKDIEQDFLKRFPTFQPSKLSPPEVGYFSFM